MKIAETQVRGVMPNAPQDRIRAFVKCFDEWSDTFGIDTKQRAAHFLSQVAHESAEMKYLEEIASGRQYEGRKDLGNTRPGDGMRFKGRGLLQLTGRANYQAYADSEYCVGDLMSHPEWLAKFPDALKSAMWYWKKRNLNRFADRDDTEGLCRAINGGMSHYAQRLYYWRKAKKALWI